MCIRIYIFIFKKTEPTKETKEEKRISVENLTGYDDIVCEFALCTFNIRDRVVNFSWLFKFNVVYVQRQNHSIYYTTRTYEVHILKNKNKRKSLRDIFVYNFPLLYLFICSCKFVVTEIRTYNIAHDENAMSSLIIQSIY